MSLLKTRQHFRPSAALSKPCITRGRIEYSPGGSGTKFGQAALDPHLYLFNLRYADLPSAAKGTLKKIDPEITGLSAQAPAETDMDFAAFRTALISGKARSETTGMWQFADVPWDALLRLPDRFSDTI